MEISEIIKNLAIGVGALATLPILRFVWAAAQTVKSIETTASQTNTRLLEFIGHVTRMLEAHEDEIEQLKIWQAEERGAQRNRRASDREVQRGDARTRE